MTSDAPPPVVIDSRAAFRAAVVDATRAAIERGARRITWVDPDFADWPLDDVPLHDLLADWLRATQRQLRLLSHAYATLERAFPRFAGWRATWAHAVDARAPDEDTRPELPTLLVDDGPIVLQVLQRDPWRGRWQRDAATARAQRDAIDAVLQRSQAAWPVRPLGL